MPAVRPCNAILLIALIVRMMLLFCDWIRAFSLAMVRSRFGFGAVLPILVR